MIRRYSRFANRKAFYDYREDPNIPEEFFEDETMGNPDITNPLDTGDFTKFSDNELYDFIIDYIKDLASVLEQGKPMPVNDMFDDLWDEAESRPNLDIDSLAETCDVIIEKAEDFKDVDKIILPGVGAYKAGMTNLEKFGLINPIKDFAKSGKCILGICLGMQLLFETSHN